MEYGLIGEKLSHSFSREIHSLIAGYNYELKEIKPCDLDSFMQAKNFKGINVTIPYKEAVIPYLHYIDENAKEIGAVNTIVNKNGLLFGYNTDFGGMKALIERENIEISGKKVLILGTGGTSKTAFAVAKSLGAREIVKVSRNAKNGTVSYQEAPTLHPDAEVIINTTPCGMYPNTADMPIDPTLFKSLEGVVDAVYNPLRTELVLKAKKIGAKASGGLYMLVMQAVLASKIFTGAEIDEKKVQKAFKTTFLKKENIVLSGMPACGKSSVGKILAESLSRKLVDTDEMIEETAKMPIPEIFEKFGEAHFRDLEAKAVFEASKLSGVVISTGGGAILREESVKNLKKNGKIFFIDRKLEDLIPTSDRPTASTVEAIKARYNERIDTYNATADFVIKVTGHQSVVAKEIESVFVNENSCN